MYVLSLFDGMSCGQIALRELGVEVDRYYASEIDRHAIAQTQLNFPETVQLGDVEQWRAWDIPWGSIDLVLAGSPCQGFSMAGYRRGLEDERSRLFWVFVEILEEVRRHNPSVVFLLENVRMKPEHETVINEALGIRPVVINSALVSAQNRVRLYWSDIRTRTEGLFGEIWTDIPQPEDRGIYIRDIVEDEVDERYYLSQEIEELNSWVQKNLRAHAEKSSTLLATSHKGARTNGMPLIAGTLRTHHDGRGFRPVAGDKSPCLPARAREDGSGQACVSDGYHLRRLTPTECARLQTIPDWYVWRCSDTQAYKMLGNGWTVDVITHILGYM